MESALHQAVKDASAAVDALKVAIASATKADRREDAKKLEGVKKKVAEIALAMELTRMAVES